MLAFAWSTFASLATAAGTLVLGLATFASVRSANRAARVAERSLQFGLRPILTASRQEDPPQRVAFGDRHWVTLEGARAVVELIDGVVYLAMMVRNVGNGMALIEAWSPRPGPPREQEDWSKPEEFQLQTRDLWIPPNDVDFWQGALRDSSQDRFGAVARGIEEGALTLELRYRDQKGGQQTLSRFALVRESDENQSEHWVSYLTHHRSLDNSF